MALPLYQINVKAKRQHAVLFNLCLSIREVLDLGKKVASLRRPARVSERWP